MPFKKGQSGNINGKPKGAKNKINTDLREKISGFLSDQFDTVKAEFKNLSPRDKIKVYSELLQYGLPKLQSTSIDIDIEQLSEEQLNKLIEKLADIPNL